MDNKMVNIISEKLYNLFKNELNLEVKMDEVKVLWDEDTKELTSIEIKFE